MTGPSPFQRTFGETPWAMGTVRGLRQWAIQETSLGVHLVGAHGGTWKPGVNHATCPMTSLVHWETSSAGRLAATLGLAPREPVKHEMVGADCTCGFYAYWTEQAFTDGEAVGVIEGFGNTVVGTRGFRCQKARIVALAPNISTRVLRDWLRQEGRFEAVETRLCKLMAHAALRYDVPVYPDVETMLKDHPVERPGDVPHPTIADVFTDLANAITKTNMKIATRLARGGNPWWTKL